MKQKEESVSLSIREWAEKVEQHEFSLWESLPDLGLYMDQVKTYINKQLSLFKRSQDDKLLTSSMVNNYVKNEMIPSPEKKKYDRSHLSSLMIISMLKRVLTIPDIAAMIQNLNLSQAELYNSFATQQQEALFDASKKIETAGEDDEALIRLAFSLAIQANAYSIVSEHILKELLNPIEE